MTLMDPRRWQPNPLPALAIPALWASEILPDVIAHYVRTVRQPNAAASVADRLLNRGAEAQGELSALLGASHGFIVRGVEDLCKRPA